MPPGVYHPNYVCFDDLDVWSQAKMIEYHRLQCYLESGGDQKKSSPPPRPQPQSRKR